MYVIRKARLSDMKDIQKIARKAWVHTYREIYPIDFIYTFVEYAYSDKHLLKLIRSVLEASPDLFLVAEEEGTGQLLGFIRMAERCMGNYELTHFYVQPDWIGRGVGSSLLGSIIELNPQAEMLTAWVEKENMDTAFFFEKKGFREVTQSTEIILGFPLSHVCYEWHRHIRRTH
ncbi:GNAT family N-acetyltransferase [Paenibacillus larvae]|nr:GNAT family N-acetyltransferase [Paenibacillus larvae]AQR79129.1 hypothetical protein BXP28_19775 [Paenibacillus larvae subsp. larvae]AQT85476.1 hypothetical protein B1222_15430 [Paenibacillus larvae subsp. pulvifaciens]AQZ47487.1 hypothetical protein B5S25_13785 [Paenibacillus larvae subsp. pulvifaciens]ARF68790.1 hypothetical protein B7C51_14805 [Paenibacillus larvae subsp. pulvifaciens]AVF23750.1 putative acetyltransferase [Paenibacillus larvae subsp. larvae]